MLSVAEAIESICMNIYFERFFSIQALILSTQNKSNKTIKTYPNQLGKLNNPSNMMRTITKATITKRLVREIFMSFPPKTNINL